MSVLQPKSRPPLERMMRVHQEIVSGSYPNATPLARELAQARVRLAILWDLRNVAPL